MLAIVKHDQEISLAERSGDTFDPFGTGSDIDAKNSADDGRYVSLITSRPKIGKPEAVFFPSPEAVRDRKCRACLSDASVSRDGNDLQAPQHIGNGGHIALPSKK